MKANGRGEGDCGAVGVGGRHARGREGEKFREGERGHFRNAWDTPVQGSICVVSAGRKGEGLVGREGGVKEGWCQECLVRALRGWNGGQPGEMTHFS